MRGFKFSALNDALFARMSNCYRGEQWFREKHADFSPPPITGKAVFGLLRPNSLYSPLRKTESARIARKCRFKSPRFTLPLGVFGKASRNTYSFGHLYGARRLPAWSPS